MCEKAGGEGEGRSPPPPPRACLVSSARCITQLASFCFYSCRGVAFGLSREVYRSVAIMTLAGTLKSHRVHVLKWNIVVSTIKRSHLSTTNPTPVTCIAATAAIY